MRTNYIFIDYENVQPQELAKLDAEHFKVFLFVGANQAKLSFELAISMQKLGERAEYVKIAGNGPNALDFHIAFYVGRLVAQDPVGYFHIISKDAGFDPLIQHLKDKKIASTRFKSVDEIPLLKVANSKSLSEKVTAVLADLKRRGDAKPGTVKALFNTINALFQKQLGEEDLSSLIAELQSSGYITIQENKVTYKDPGCHR
ncbi:MAG: PIN domain-containing protein [Nevskia sp.]|nr:PIN domain-containing protein [Nevskia sp.]MCK9385994.1 PIN domain-containing protein [Nevskia sp.]